MEARDGSFNSQKEITYQNERRTKDIVYYLPPSLQLIICLACIGYHSGTRHEFRHEMEDGSVRIQCNTVNQQEMRVIESMTHDVLLTQKHKPLSSHFNQESCEEHNRFDQQDIFQERNRWRRREGVCDNNDDARAKWTLAVSWTNAFRTASDNVASMREQLDRSLWWYWIVEKWPLF